MRTKRMIWLLLVLLLAACNRREVETTPTLTITGTPAGTATRAATKTPGATATATPTPEPPQPELSAVEQTVDDDGEIVLSKVYAVEPSWVVLYADKEGEPGEVIGYVPVDEGESDDVLLQVDPYLVTERLHVRLHEDTGEDGTFEFPDGDELITVDGERVEAVIDVEIDVTMPAITVSDQDLGEAGQIVVDNAISAGPGWVAVHADEGGEPGEILGQTPLRSGENHNVLVTFNWRKATQRLHAVLYKDAGEAGRFEPQAEDETVIIDDEPIRTAFTATLPPDVLVINQPVATGEVYVDRATVNQPGWIAVYSNYNGFIDRRLGYARLEPGVNENIRIPVDTENVTSMLHIMLHEDIAVEGEFEYPVEDPPVRNNEGQLLLFSFQIDTGNYLITEDQPLGEKNTVRIPLVVIDLNAWVVVWTDENGEPGEIVGQTLVERGVNRDVVVTIDPEAATDTLHVLLHQDAGELETFEYPNGPDGILRREEALIQAPLRLLSANEQ